jgi:hypothetical protein
LSRSRENLNTRADGNRESKAHAAAERATNGNTATTEEDTDPGEETLAVAKKDSDRHADTADHSLGLILSRTQPALSVVAE